MDASTLELPDALDHAKYIDGMREIIGYDVAANSFFVRYDTVINGRQYGHMLHSIPGPLVDAKQVFDSFKEVSKNFFESIEASI